MKRTGVVLAAALSLAGLSGCGPGYETDDRGVAVEPQDLASEAEVWAAYRQISPNSNFLGGDVASCSGCSMSHISNARAGRAAAW